MVGSERLSTGRMYYSLQSFKIHPGYNEYNVDNDICLLKLTSSIQFGLNVRPIGLGNTVQLGKYATVLGWGRLSDSNRYMPDQLQGASVLLLDLGLCYSRYSPYFTQNMVCAGNWGSGNQDACQVYKL